jgi:uncharacterized membrane protein
LDVIQPAAEICAGIIEAMGILIITGFAAYVMVYAVIRSLDTRRFTDVYDTVRRRLGRGILLGLEFLVAADIIHTVAVDLSYQTVGVLAIIVLIRTFLSFTLDVELTGRWPWQQREQHR